MLLPFYELARACAPGVHPATLERIVRVESSFNPYAIGVVRAKLAHQPKSLAEAKATVAMLEQAGYNYSLGLSQVNKSNFKRYGLTPDSAFDPCENLRAGSEILIDCYRAAEAVNGTAQDAVRDALSCYYTGDLKRGHRLGYVAKVVTGDSHIHALKHGVKRPVQATGERIAPPAGPANTATKNSSLLF